MDPTGLIILVVTVLFLLALGVWAITKGREVQYPEGAWVERTAWGVRLRVVFAKGLEGVPSLGLADTLVWYTYAAAQAWGQRYPAQRTKALEVIRHVVVSIKPESMAAECMCGGVQGWVFRAIGGTNIPLVTLPETSMDSRLPAFVVHEVLHAIRAKCKGGADPLHQDHEVWKGVEDTGKSIARGERLPILGAS